MKFETIMSRLLEAAFIDYHQGGRVIGAMEEEKNRILNELEPPIRANLQFGAFEFINHSGFMASPVVTVCFGGQGQLERLSDLSGAAIIRIQDNHRVLATKGALLGDREHNHFSFNFCQGTTAKERQYGTNKGYYKSVAPFDLGDLSGTDHSSVYMLARAAFPREEALVRLGEEKFPPEEVTLRVLEPYQRRLSPALSRRYAA